MTDPFLSRVAQQRLAPDDAARLERLRATVAQARQAPFYADRLAGADPRSLADLATLPLTRKSDLKGHPADAFRAVPMEQVWHFHESFGTTGAPVPGWYTLDDLEVELDVIGRWLKHFAPGRTVMNRYPYAFPVPAQLVEAAVRLRGGCLIPTSNLTYNVGYQRVLRLMQERRVDVVTAMPLEAVLLKEAALESGRNPATDFPDLKAFCFAGRILTPSWRRSMMQDWSCDVLNLYGCTEGGPMATSGDDGELLLHDDFFLFEVIDPQTLQPLHGDDVTGGLVLTTLCRDAQPMVRYYTEDLVRVQRTEAGRRVRVLGRAGHLLRWGGREITQWDLEEEVLSWQIEHGSNVFFVVVTDRGLRVRVEVPEPGRVDRRDGERRLSLRLGVPVHLDVLPRGRLVNHVSLVTSPAVFKPRTVSDHRVEARKVINLSGGLIDWWAEFTPKLVGQFLWKSVVDFFAGLRLRLLG